MFVGTFLSKKQAEAAREFASELSESRKSRRKKETEQKEKRKKKDELVLQGFWWGFLMFRRSFPQPTNHLLETLLLIQVTLDRQRRTCKIPPIWCSS